MILAVSFPGLLFDGQELELGPFSETLQVTGFAPGVEIAPSGAALTARIQNETGASPAGFIEATIPDGASVPVAVATGSFSLAAGSVLYLRIVTASGAQVLRGHVEFGAISVAANLDDLTTVALVKQYLGITHGLSDALLQALVTGVSLHMQGCMNRFINNDTAVIEFTKLWNETCIVVYRPPIQSITEIAQEGDFDAFTTVLDATDYRVADADAGIIELAAGKTGDVRTTYSGGYTSTPLDLQTAATREVARAYRDSTPGGERLGLESSVIDTGGTTAYIIRAFLPETVSAMERYRRLLP